MDSEARFAITLFGIGASVIFAVIVAVNLSRSEKLECRYNFKVAGATAEEAIKLCD